MMLILVSEQHAGCEVAIALNLLMRGMISCDNKAKARKQSLLTFLRSWVSLEM
jgi:hypothetical protein